MRMNRFVVGAVASLLALGTVAPAFADNDHRGRGHDRHDDRHDRRHDRHDRHDRRDWRDDRRREAHHDRRYYDNRGYYRPAPPPRVSMLSTLRPVVLVVLLSVPISAALIR